MKQSRPIRATPLICSYDIVGVCRLNNVFIIGKGTKAYISLPRGKGVRLTIAEERDKRIAAKVAAQ